MTRLPDWPERLDRVVAAARDRAFAWGSFDCCLFAADAVAAVTGIDPAVSWRETYADACSAVRLLARVGGLEVVAMRVAGHYGWRGTAPVFLGRGDLALVRLDDGRPALAVCLGARFALPAMRGLAVLDRAQALSGWKVG
jgi:hypothetical protein